MRRVLVSLLALHLLLLISCNKVKLPIKTSLGDLVRIEKRDAVETSDKRVTPKPDETLYMLTFEGKSEIVFEGTTGQDGPNKLPLVDSKGTQFTPVFGGSPAKDGALSNKEWKMNGSMRGADGNWVFSGTMTFPEPTVALLYLIPNSSSGLALKDGDQRHPIN